MSSNLKPVLLKVDGLSKSFGAVRAVDGINMTITTGEIVGLIGPNGCGKSTTIDCVTGFARPSGGRIMFAGKDLTGLKPDRIAAAGLLRTFQNVRVYDRLTLVENLAIARQSHDRLAWWQSYLGTSATRACEEKARERGRELVDIIGLTRLADMPAGFLSYGQKKLLALAMTLMADPELVILDEPLAGVNPTVIRRVAELILKLNREGITFLIVEHNVQFIMQQCHRVIVMEQGRQLANGPPNLIWEDDRVLQAYLGSADRVAKELAFHA
jgi:branched-chain amino acid transport system ATP-binding protein